MTNEEAIEILREEHNYVQEPCYVMNAIKKAIEALHAAEKCDHNATEMRPSFISDHSGGANKMVDHVDEVGNMAPLTLEQLRQMDGKPVWVQNLEEPEKSQWRLCHWDRGKYLVLQGISVQGYLEEDYGEAWLAYAYQPARIDREAWEPCELCGRLGEVDPCYKDGCFKENAPKCDFRCGKFLDYRADKRRLDGAMFCPKCGRPLTPEARAMLEKRLRGVMICRCGI